MRYNLILLSIASLAFTLPSCNFNGSKNDKDGLRNGYDSISVNGQYSMHIPKFMTKATKLNEEASLQYQNIFRETYVIVIDENKEEFINAYTELDSFDTLRSVISNYADTQVQLITSGATVINRTEISTLTINGLDAARTEIDASLEGIKAPITYFLTFVEGKETLYMIMAWTLQDKKDTHRAMFEEMAKSFIE
jgi:hypothetical protein